jgi:hypothetical protein
VLTRITRQLWSPDTCDCQIYTLFDADLPPEQRTQTAIEVGPNEVENHPAGTVRCDAHTGRQHDDAHEHYLTVLEENQRKNKAHTKVNGQKHEIKWRWEGTSPNRVLIVTDQDGNESKHKRT